MVMSKWLSTLVTTGAFLYLVSCENSPVSPVDTTLLSYPVREYALERNPSVNVWGCAMNFVNSQSIEGTSGLDIKYLLENDTSAYDLKFYTVKVYFTDESGNVKSEGCPAMLFSANSRGCQIGTGIAFFTSYTAATQADLANLKNEPVIDYASCLNGKGQYDRNLLFAELNKCIIGQKFRSGQLVIPEGKTELEVQPVFLIETADGGYVKFMVKQFKGDPPNEQKTTVMYQILSVNG